MDIRYDDDWNIEKFMEENGGFDIHLIVDYLICTELAYFPEDKDYLKSKGIEDISPYIYEAQENLEQ